jgi:hypothetical protein
LHRPGWGRTHLHHPHCRENLSHLEVKYLHRHGPGRGIRVVESTSTSHATISRFLGIGCAAQRSLRLVVVCHASECGVGVRGVQIALAERPVQRLPSDEHARTRSDPCELEAVYLFGGTSRNVGRIWLGRRIATSFPTYTPLVPQRLRRIDKPTTAVSDPPDDFCLAVEEDKPSL